MTQPANLRVNIGAPFPSFVTGLGAVVIGKLSGIWTVALNYMAVAALAPPAGSLGGDYVLVYDSTAKNFFRMPLNGFVSGRLQRSVTAAGPVLPNDQAVNINLAAPAILTLPAYATRGGVSVTFKGVPGSATATIQAAAGENIDGLTQIPVPGGASLTIVPYNDGVNAGWAIE